jgi:hypothetical protein
VSLGVQTTKRPASTRYSRTICCRETKRCELLGTTKMWPKVSAFAIIDESKARRHWLRKYAVHHLSHQEVEFSPGEGDRTRLLEQQFSQSGDLGNINNNNGCCRPNCVRTTWKQNDLHNLESIDFLFNVFLARLFHPTMPGRCRQGTEDANLPKAD